jgi:hypothetical protein
VVDRARQVIQQPVPVGQRSYRIGIGHQNQSLLVNFAFREIAPWAASARYSQHCFNKEAVIDAAAAAITSFSL